MTGAAPVLAVSGEDDGFWADAYPIIPHPAEIIVGLVAFAILYWIVRTKVAPAFERVLAERQDAIEGGISRAEQAQAEAQRALEDYRAQLAASRADAASQRDAARQEGAVIVAQMREQAQAEAQRITAAARQQIEADRQQAFNELRSQVGRMATDLAERIVGESLQDDDRQRRVVDRFLADLEQGPSEQGPSELGPSEQGPSEQRSPAGAGGATAVDG